ncbi:MAG: M20/M25/M40 family metallo-hydrolase [Deltaproteobacteria bacterium]|nr:M20/M25/M40 family metallo-hydrolase [Deltaproteobacteria bacterium]
MQGTAATTPAGGKTVSCRTLNKGRRTVDDRAMTEDAVATMSRYVQFDTTNPPGNEMPAALWVRDQLASRSITSDIRMYEPLPGRGLVVARIPGKEDLKPLMVNHHIDVVAADSSQWTHPPFSGLFADGFVWGRGTLDTKGLGVMFMLALESLLKEGVKFRRPIVFTAVPDEEPGGDNGMRWLVENHLNDIDPEWVWDEGSGGLRNVFGQGTVFAVAVAEKQIYRFKLIAQGEPGHGSMPHADSANTRLIAALQRILNAHRPMKTGPASAAMFAGLARTQKFPASFLLAHLGNPLLLKLAGKKLAAQKFTNAVLRDTVSVNIIQAGYQINVIPERAEAQLDCRLLPETDAREFQEWLVSRIADPRIRIEMIQTSGPSGLAPMDNPFYHAVSAAIKKNAPGARVFPLLMAGATDGRYWRERGYPAYGFTPMILEKNDIGRVHGIDERISADNLLLGIKMARDILRTLCA